jgi:beta-mannosidase
VKQAFMPRLVSNVMEKGQLATYIVTDEYEGTVNLQLTAVDLNGTVIWQEEMKNIALHPNASVKVHAIDTAAVLKGKSPSRVIFYTQLRIDNKDMERNIFYFAAAKDMSLEIPHLEVVTSKAANDKDAVYIRLKTDKLARNVYLWLDNAGATAHFEDNYFDLLPGETRTIRLQTKQLPEIIQQALKVTTLESSYKH